jgi:hypothetical protein
MLILSHISVEFSILKVFSNPTLFTFPFLYLATAAKKAQNLLLFFIYLGIYYE